MLHIVQYTIRRTGCVQKHKVVSTAIRTAPQNGLLALLLPGRSVLVYINIAHSPGVTGCASSKIVDRIDYLHWLPFQCQVQRQSYLFSRDVQVNPLPQHGLDWSSKFRSELFRHLEAKWSWSPGWAYNRSTIHLAEYKWVEFEQAAWFIIHLHTS